MALVIFNNKLLIREKTLFITILTDEYLCVMHQVFLSFCGFHVKCFLQAHMFEQLAPGDRLISGTDCLHMVEGTS